MSDAKPQDVQFGNQPPKNAEVQFGKQPETAETNVTVAGDSEPAHDDADPDPDRTQIGVIPVYAGGDPVPDDDADDDADDAPDITRSED